jgi:T5SS/PEP-CTERM-associated repeat protein
MASLLFPSIAFAQFPGDYELNIISGVTSNWSSTYIVGSNTVSDILIIQNAGVLNCGTSYIGYEANADNNLVLVNGPGSSWNCYDINIGLSGSANTLRIENGGQVSCTFGTIGYNDSSSNNLVLVSGSNSALSSISFGNGSGYGNQLVVTNGGRVSNQGSPSVGQGYTVTVTDGGQYTTYGTVCVGATVAVTGTGSTWTGGFFSLQGFSTITISNGGQLLVPYDVDLLDGSSNQLTIAEGGTLTTSNLLVQSGVLSIRGTVNTSSLSLTSTSGTISFDGGTLNAASVSTDFKTPLTVGNRINAATLRLTGARSSLFGGLSISSNAVLTGCGTIETWGGPVVIDAGGTILSECTKGAMTFSSVVITNNGTMRAINGSVLEIYGSLVNNGTIDIIDGGVTNFHGSFINHGTVLDATNVKVSGLSASGLDFVVQIPSVNGHTYQLQYSTSLAPANWMNTVAPQPGTGGVLTFTDAGAAANLQRFYRVDVTAP